MEPAHIFTVLLIAVSLSACAGIRAFIPPFAVSILAMSGYVTLGPNFAWMGRWEVMIAFGLAAVIEIIADKYPGVDHALDAAGLVIKPVAGFLLTTALISNMDPWLGLALGIIVGAGSAGAVQLVRAKLRLASSSLTAGLANPALSVIEDGSAIGATLLAVFVPLATAVLFFGGLCFAFWLHKRLHRKKQHVSVE